MLQMLAPVLLGVQAGSMVGYLAQHALGRYDLPLPTQRRAEPRLRRRRTSTRSRRRGRSHARTCASTSRSTRSCTPPRAPCRGCASGSCSLASEYVSGYEIDPDAFEQRFGDDRPERPARRSARSPSSPRRCSARCSRPRQDDARRRLQLLTAVLEGYADAVLERVGQRLIPSFARIHEAMQRHRLERGEAERFIEGLLGLKLDATTTSGARRSARA